MLIALSGSYAMGEEIVTHESEDYCYVLRGDGTAMITDYKGFASKLSIPGELDGYTVTAIGEMAFYDCNSLISITIPDSVTSIGKNAFYKCSENLILTVARGSFAAEWCKENGMNYTYPDALDWLKQ